MRSAVLKYTVLAWVSGVVMAILLLVPFHAFFTVWLASHFGHYTAFRLWKEVLLIACFVCVAYLLATDHKIRFHTLSRRLVWLILSYIFLNIAWGLLALNQHDVTAKALGYGLIINLRFLVFFLVAWATALRLARLRLNGNRLVYWPAVVVVVFGLLQIFLLPTDFLRHFGYSDATIPAYETINNNPNYVRIAATLRGANPLGAYLVIPISLVSVAILRGRRNWRQFGLLTGLLVVLVASYSRSAWIGAVLSVLVILLASLRTHKSKQGAAIVLAIVAIAAGSFAYGFRHNDQLQNFLFHTTNNSAIKVSSNQGHVSAVKDGFSNLRHQPLGDGPGTAGPASYYNTGHQVRIAENYFIQIGQETGWLGLFLFLLINLGVGVLLWLRRADPLALSLFASLIGLTFINLLSHAWTDDTLAYVWWGLAGIAMAELPKLEVAKAATPTKPKAKDAKTK